VTRQGGADRRDVVGLDEGSPIDQWFACLVTGVLDPGGILEMLATGRKSKPWVND